MRMSYDPESAIQAMQEGLNPSRPHSFAQADMLVRGFWPISLSTLLTFFIFILSSLFLNSHGHFWDKTDTRKLQIRSSRS